jgi:segregation and condensation protein A
VPDALDHLRAMLGRVLGEGVALASLVPLGHDCVRSPLQRRAALASTTLAALELAREGEVTLGQAQPFELIIVAPDNATPVRPGNPAAAPSGAA